MDQAEPAAAAESEQARDAEAAAREAARDAQQAELPVFVWVIPDPTTERFSEITTGAVNTIESFDWRLEHVTSRAFAAGDPTTIHTLFFRRTRTTQ